MRTHDLLPKLNRGTFTDLQGFGFDLSFFFEKQNEAKRGLGWVCGDSDSDERLVRLFGFPHTSRLGVLRESGNPICVYTIALSWGMRWDTGELILFYFILFPFPPGFSFLSFSLLALLRYCVISFERRLGENGR